jgi:hypothetical protein
LGLLRPLHKGKILIRLQTKRKGDRCNSLPSGIGVTLLS